VHHLLPAAREESHDAISGDPPSPVPEAPTNDQVAKGTVVIAVVATDTVDRAGVSFNLYKMAGAVIAECSGNRMELRQPHKLPMSSK
jgi:hypothetical protein